VSLAARAVIDRLRLDPHPEGGWYRETWRAPASGGARGAATSILFLLEAHQRSHWHRIDATELWLHHAGGAMTLETAAEGVITRRRLGPDIMAGDLMQARIEPHQWQAAEAANDWVLVACVVVPAFDFAHFELAPPGWDPRGLIL
jgi:predicted cupin superfamily sugar epimerase